MKIIKFFGKNLLFGINKIKRKYTILSNESKILRITNINISFLLIFSAAKAKNKIYEIVKNYIAFVTLSALIDELMKTLIGKIAKTAVNHLYTGIILIE